jgi:hypothetical protein
VFLPVASKIIRQPGSDQTVVDAIHRSSWTARPPPVGARTGQRTARVSARSCFSPGRSRATFTRIGSDTPRSCSRREGPIDTVLPVEPACRRCSYGQPCRPREVGRVELRAIAGCFPTYASVPAALSRGFLRYQEVDRRHTLLFGKAIEFTPMKARSPSLFPTSAVSNVQMPGSAQIVTNVPVHDSPCVCSHPRVIAHTRLVSRFVSARALPRAGWRVPSFPGIRRVRGSA